jgi:2-polyprenyl-6-methoxyphenol hydroxylase-like FAD-dependent oxidoreductase
MLGVGHIMRQVTRVGSSQGSTSLSVGILGGSIAGCAVAVELARAGCDVVVLESRGEEPKDRGAGIGLPLPLVKTLVERDLIDADMPHFDVSPIVHVARDEQDERHGRVLWEQPGSIALVNWGTLYRNLRRRVPGRGYRTGCRAVGVREINGSVAVELNGGETHWFDLLVCADGHGSLGRRTLFPDTPVRYVGYVLWRGAVEEKDLSEVTPLEGALCWPCYPGGHGPFYLVPGNDGSIAPGRRLVNWGLHLSVFEVDRAELLTGKNPPAYAGPLPAEREARLKAWVPDVLPGLYAEIVTKSAGTAVQMIHESTVPAYREGRICLAGDAGALARPHTGTGALKGIMDAVTLADALTGHPSLDDALTHWSEEQTLYGNELVRLSGQIGKALATEIPTGEPDAAAKWFSSIVTVPSEVFGPLPA